MNFRSLSLILCATQDPRCVMASHLYLEHCVTLNSGVNEIPGIVLMLLTHKTGKGIDIFRRLESCREAIGVSCDQGLLFK